MLTKQHFNTKDPQDNLGAFVGRRLEATVAHLRRGVDELELDLFQGGALGVHQQRLAERDDTALGTDAATLHHDKVLVDLTVEREATHRRDRLVGKIVLGGGTLRAMMVTLLTGTGHGERDTRRMPRTDTSDLAQTLVRLARQLLRMPTAGHTLETLALGDGHAVNHLVLAEHLRHRDRLLEVLLHPVHLILDGATVQLDLDDVGLLLALLDQTNLEVGNGERIRILRNFSDFYFL
uniref:Uncharacterized protein n=1 Tax=Anopheles atroparvus TaxID=41427 RepID=A0A182JAU2_ANOAO